MNRIFSITNSWVLLFASFFLLSACTKTGYYGTIQESMKVEQKQTETIKSQEPQEAKEAQATIKPKESQEAQEALKPKVPPFFLLLVANESERFDLTIAAFKEHLTQYQPDAEYLYHIADSAANLNASLFVSPKTKSPPAMVISFGTPAAEIAQTAFPDTPGLTAMMPQENMIPHKKNSPAILLQVPLEEQLKWIKRFLPNARRVGILYDPALNGNLIEEAASRVKEENIEIIPFKLNSPKQLQEGLHYIRSNADVLLAIPDQTVYSRKTAKEILLFSYRNRIPFVGLSESWVKAGALYAIDIDYEELGRQIARLTNKILTEGSPGEKSVINPEGVIYWLNIRTSNYLRLEIDNDIRKGASIVFE